MQTKQKVVLAAIVSTALASPLQASVITSFDDSDVWSVGGNESGEITGNVPGDRTGAVRLDSGASLVADWWDLDPSIPVGADITWSFDIYGDAANASINGFDLWETFGNPDESPNDRGFGLDTEKTLSSQNASDWYLAEWTRENVPGVTDSTEDYDLTAFELLAEIAEGDSLYISSASVDFSVDGEMFNAASVDFGPRDTAQVPAPASVYLMIVGALGLVGVAGRRRLATADS